MADNFENILVATRIHRRFASKEAPIDLNPLVNFVLRSSVNSIVISTDGDDSVLINALNEFFLESIKNGRVSILPVSPHGRIIPPLNALVQWAAINPKNFKYILFQSVEVLAGREDVATLLKHMNEETLVVGKAFNPHAFHSGKIVEITGETTPWNTMAIWSLSKLSLTGFLLVAEGLNSEVVSATEEVTTICLHQMLRPSLSQAKLVKIGSNYNDGWSTNWPMDEERRVWHKKKMETKISSVETQLKVLNMTRGYVEHIHDL
ncbi:hypothetical protein HK096_006469 [Nowakowskiella sp. JEL0078]|nr:hypothetical protein HK096_006469 [Nowakowskiella sp. JEL0078]